MNICREKREDGRKRFRLEVGCDSPVQASTVGSFSTPINTKPEGKTMFSLQIVLFHMLISISIYCD